MAIMTSWDFYTRRDNFIYRKLYDDVVKKFTFPSIRREKTDNLKMVCQGFFIQFPAQLQYGSRRAAYIKFLSNNVYRTNSFLDLR